MFRGDNEIIRTVFCVARPPKLIILFRSRNGDGHGYIQFPANPAVSRVIRRAKWEGKSGDVLPPRPHPVAEIMLES